MKSGITGVDVMLYLNIVIVIADHFFDHPGPVPAAVAVVVFVLLVLVFVVVVAGIVVSDFGMAADPVAAAVADPGGDGASYRLYPGCAN